MNLDATLLATSCWDGLFGFPPQDAAEKLDGSKKFQRSNVILYRGTTHCMHFFAVVLLNLSVHDVFTKLLRKYCLVVSSKMSFP